jgi:hypothetical protein
MAKTYQIKMNYPAHTTWDGVPVEEKIVEKEIPFGLYEIVYYAYKKRNRWVLRKSEIRGIWATNIVGVRLDNEWCINEDEFDRLYKKEDLKKALDFCTKQSERAKVKIYNKNSW